MDDDIKKRLAGNNWIKTLDDAVRQREATTKEPFAPTATTEELAAGFIETTAKNPNSYAFESDRIRVVARILEDDLMAIKLVSPSGQTEYAIVDRETLKPKRDIGHFSLIELSTRYPPAN